MVGGLCAYALLLLISGVPESITTAVHWFVWCILGSLFPDIDTTSKGQKIFYRLVFLFLVILLIQQQGEFFILLSLTALIPFVVRHRGVFHRIWFLVLFVGMLYVIGVSAFPWVHGNVMMWNMIFFFAGVVSHLLLDGGVRRL